MSEFQNVVTNEFTLWQGASAYNNQYTYNYINNSQFYASIPVYLRPFYQRRVQQWLWWYDGYVPYFHNNNGIMATHLATSIVNKLTKKVFGSRLLLKTAGKIVGTKDSLKKMTEWAEKTNLEKALRKAVTFAGAGGTALLKTNKAADGELWIEPVRMDRFVSIVDTATGKIQSVECYLLTTATSDREDDKGTYFLVEKRYYGDYRTLTGEEKHDVPLVVYSVYRSTGASVNMGVGNPKGKERIPFSTLPKNVKKAVLGQFGAIDFDNPKPLPFTDLGCDLLCWTNGVSGLPELPYGESILDSIIALLQEYDYANSAMATDMYVGRGRVLVPAMMLNNNILGGVENWNAGLDSGIYTKMPSNSGADEKPIPLQFELRSAEWKALRDYILESIAVNIGVSTSSIGAFLNDGSARTAREVSAEENETVAYVADTRGILEAPINEMLDRVRIYKSLDEKVVIRWTQANLSNPYMLTEMKASQVANGLTSLEDAIADLNPDDDEDEIKRKVERAKADYQERAGMTAPFDDGEEDPTLEL